MVEQCTKTDDAQLSAVASGAAQSNAEALPPQAPVDHGDWLRVTLANIDDAVITIDTAGRITSMNAMAEVLTAWSSGDALGKPLTEVFQIVDERTRQPVESRALGLLRKGIVGFAQDSLLVARDGSERTIEDSAAPIRDEAGKELGAILVFRDISDRKQAEADAARLAAIVESSDDAIISKTLDGTIRTWNAAAERMFGYTADEAVGKSITLIIPAERLAEEHMILDKIRRGERVEHFETVRMTKDGSPIDLSLGISPIRNNRGEIVGASKIARDITDRKRAEEAQRFLADVGDVLAGSLDSRTTLRTVASLCVPRLADWCAVDMLEAGHVLRRVAVAHTDPEKVRWAHEIHRRYPPDPQSGRGVFKVLRTGHADLHAEISDEQLTRAARDPGELQILRELGMTSVMLVPLRARGQTLGVISLISAESRRHFGPADLALAEEVARRAGLAADNARLYGELVEADRRKDDFIALLAHELRNPLAPMRNGLQVMRLTMTDTGPPAQARNMMERQLGHMVRLIDDLLDISRVSRNKMELRRSRVLLADLVNSAVETARPGIEEAGHQLTISLPPKPVILDGDLTRLAQVFSNLLTNSAKYTEPGGHIWLDAERKGNEIVISVRDSGIGIPAESLPRIFDMFSQVDRTMERSTGGLGIGLALVKGLVEMHGGTVTAKSEGQGKGSTFTVKLPVPDDLPNPGASHGADEIRPTVGIKNRILIVDDNQDSALSLAMMLKLMGSELRVVHDGFEAVRVAEEFRPDVILMDVGMPRLNGLDATRRIREQDWGKAITIIALTGWGQDQDKARSQEAGCDAHLVKPVNPDDLEKLLNELMKKDKRD